MTVKAFLEYYQSQGIIPVQQNIPDMRVHFRRRAGLFRQLGIPYRTIAGSNFLEFGPGTGQNAIFTAMCHPKQLTLVDANQASLEATRRNLATVSLDNSNIHLVESTIEAFTIDQPYDFVLCEGVIPFQNSPESIASMVAQSVSPGGVLIITCVDPISYFSEVLRRTLKPLILPLIFPKEAVVSGLVRFFTPDLDALPAMSRKKEDWVQDVILHPYRGGHLFSIPQALKVLGDQFDVQGASPNFIVDWRWYKQLAEDDPGTNAQALASYKRSGALLIDYRVEREAGDSIDAFYLFELCQKAYDRHFDAWDGDQNAVGEIMDLATKVADLIADQMQITAASIRDWYRLADELQKGHWVEPEAFAGYFGRGQQYLSFIRRESW